MKSAPDRTVITPLVLLVVCLLLSSCAKKTSSDNESGQSPLAEQGGVLTATYRSEPTSYHRLTSVHAADDLVRLLTQDTLVRVNRETGQVEARLAESWTHSDDGLTWTLALREGVAFSDGVPFSSADVVFTFRALFDPRVASPIAGDYLIAGQPLAVRALDTHTVVVQFPAPYGPGVALFDGLPMLPQHKLGNALETGTFAESWTAGTPPDDLAGLGPFVISEHLPGQKVVFTRNPRFWNTDEQGRPLPYLDRIDLLVIPEQNAEILQLESGVADVISGAVRPEDISALSELAVRGRLRIVQAGVSPDVDALWFNLVPGAPTSASRPWLVSDELRRAVSTAVNRVTIVNSVYLGEAEPAYGPITPGYGDWYVADLPKTPYDPDAARALLAEAGLEDRNGDGLVDDASGRTARFSILTQAGHTVRQRAVSVIQDELRQIGLQVDVESADPNTMFERFSRAEYDAMYFGFQVADLDPAGLAGFWMSAGPFHFWHPLQPKPATAWEARIDEVFARHAMTLDRAERIRLFADAQRILSEHQPVIYFAAPKVAIALSTRVGGAEPSVLLPPVLWNAERLFVVQGAAGAAGR